VLPRSKAGGAVDLDARVPKKEVYVCPEPTCQQQFHLESTRETVLDHLLYDTHTTFSYRKGENVFLRTYQKLYGRLFDYHD
jgi:hypothetical protein